MSIIVTKLITANRFKKILKPKNVLATVLDGDGKPAMLNSEISTVAIPIEFSSCRQPRPL